MNHFVETYDPTIEDSYRKQILVDSQACMLEVLDTAGQEEYTALRDQWIRDGEGFVIVYSVIDRVTFSKVERFYHQIRRVKEAAAASSGGAGGGGGPGSPTIGRGGGGPGDFDGSNSSGGGSGGGGSPGAIPIMLVGNKIDLLTKRAVSAAEGSQLARKLGCMFRETSAMTCTNVEQAFFDVVRQLRRERLKESKENSSRAKSREAAFSTYGGGGMGGGGGSAKGMGLGLGSGSGFYGSEGKRAKGVRHRCTIL